VRRSREEGPGSASLPRCCGHRATSLLERECRLSLRAGEQAVRRRASSEMCTALARSAFPSRRRSLQQLLLRVSTLERVPAGAGCDLAPARRTKA